jgi:hypothetical protein
MTGPAYPLARVAALHVRPHFAQHPGGPPELDAVEAVIGAAFWASLRREEGYIPRISLALLSPDAATRPMRFAQPLPLAAGALVQLAPAVERPGVHLGVWRASQELCVWGTTHSLPPFCFVLEVTAPGLLVVKHSRGEGSGKFVNVAVLEGDQIKLLSQEAAPFFDGPSAIGALLVSESAQSPGSANLLLQLALSMRAHGRGGLLLVVPQKTDSWRESVVQPVRYSLSPHYSELTELIQSESERGSSRPWQESVRRVVDTIGGLTAVDGATVINDAYELLAFGAKIGRRDGWPLVARVVVTEPVQGGTAVFADPAAIGGTRHLAAAQFGHDQRDAAALVASQDGRFTIFAWSGREQAVRAHRVETLLL